MAKRERSSGSPDVEVDMTPMIDIVFQLIAFFAVITNFEETQADERVKLPRDTLAKPPEVKVEHQLVLNVGFYRNMEGEKIIVRRQMSSRPRSSRATSLLYSKTSEGDKLLVFPEQEGQRASCIPRTLRAARYVFQVSTSARLL